MPADIDLAFLRGVQLEQVAFGEHQVQLHFSRQVRLFLECTYRVEKAGIVCTFEGARDGATEVLAWIGRTVTAAERLDDRTLHLAFDDGRALHVVDDSDQYESFQLWNGDALTVV